MTANGSGSRPEKKFQAGGVVASVWVNTRSFNGQPQEIKSVSLERRYKDSSGEWKSSTSFSINELPKVLVVAAQAYSYLVLHDRGEEP